ncbi:epoxyqueuosine reductase [bacterium]|nr:epoxyqueuosine reductase [bacterium]
MKDAERNYARLRDFVLSQGACLFGVADVRQLKKDFLNLSQAALKSLDYGISLAVRLSDPIIEDIVDRPTKLYFYHYRRLNALLDEIALKITGFIQKEGAYALPIPSSQVIDWERQRGHLSHRKIALEAGLGWMGRNNLLVNSEFGSRLRLVTVLTSFPLITDSRKEPGCGDCRACIPLCPAGAIKERREDFQHLACYRKLDFFRKQCNIGHHICGICVKACPGRVTRLN